MLDNLHYVDYVQNMKNVQKSVSVPADLAEQMRKLPHIRWAYVALAAFRAEVARQHGLRPATFREWLLRQTDREDEIGTLARDTEYLLEQEPDIWPSQDDEGLAQILLERNACAGANQALLDAAEEYRTT